MTLQPSDLAAGSLYATFYCDSQKPTEADKLATRLIDKFSLEPEGDFWKNEADSIFLFRFPLMNDTLGVQIVLNDTPPWAVAYDYLNQAINYSYLQHIWGYTLIYQAHVAVTATVNLNKVDLSALLGQLEPLGQPGRAPRQPFAHSRLKWGHLWLIEIPDSGEDIHAAMLYLALSPTEQQAANLATHTLLYTSQTMLSPDLIAHKGYHEIRQYKQQPTYDKLKQKLKSMRQNAAELLRQAQPTAFGLPNEQGQITHITQNYAELVATNQPDLHKWHIALSKQDENYPTLWQLESKGGGRSEINLNIASDVFEYHHRRIKIGLRELELLMAEAENAQTVTQAAIEATHTASELRREKLQEWFNLILAVVGLGLTLAQLITDNLAQALPTYLGQAEATTPLAQLGVKLFVMGILALVILTIWAITNYRNSKK